LHPPTSAGQEFTIDDVTYVTIAVIPLSSGLGYRIPARIVPSSPDVATDPISSSRTFVFKNGEDPVQLPHPFPWESVGEAHAAPLACELRVGDSLPPAAGKPGRPNEHRTDADIRSTMVVNSVHYDEFRGTVQIVTRDAQGLVRRYHRSPDESVDFSRPYVRKTPSAPAIPSSESGAATGTGFKRAVQPEEYEGPFTSPTGAQFIFQKRSTRGGRIPKTAPLYDPTLPPQFDETSGDLLPYVVMAPSQRESIVGTWGTVHAFSPTARRLPQVQRILRDHGVPLPGEESA